MKPINEVTACVVDFGLFLPVASKLSQDCKRVLYVYPPSIKGFPTLGSSIIGDGFDNLERVEEFWPHINEIDLFVFNDIGQSGLQLYLESIGKAVWGARAADEVETNRELFNRILKRTGLPVPKCETVNGLSKLRVFLSDKQDRFIKISKYRGDLETFHWRDNDLDSGRLDALALKFGPAQDIMDFMVFDPIEAATEVGGDTYCIDGQWPSLMFHGHESKDKAYLGAVTPRDEMPEELQSILEAFGPVFQKQRYRSSFSMETRDGIFTDPTCRGGLPSTASQINTWSNFSEIIWAGANGILVEPEPCFKFSSECILSLKGKPNEWGKIRVEGDLIDACKFNGACEIDGAICFPPDDHEGEDVGWLVAGGETMEEAIEEMHRLAGQLPEGLSAATDELAGLLAKIKEGEAAGAEFSNQPVPEPETAVQVD